MLKKNYFTISILFGFLLRLLSYYFFRDYELDNEWGILFKNYINFKTIGINVFDGQQVKMSIASANEVVLPSVYMPPFYLFFIIFLNFFFTEKYLISAILFSQIILSIISSYFFFKLLKKFFNKRISFIGFLIFIYFPLNVYASTQVSSITLQVFCIILFFYFFNNFLKKKNYKNLILFSFFSTILILLRGEFILFLIFSYAFILFKTKNLKKILISFSLIVFLVTPYLLRNYLIFEEITLTKTFGINLWKGNNKFSKTMGNENLYDDRMIEELKQIEPNKYYEIKKDKIYMKYALINISQHPSDYFKLYLKKIITFIFYAKESTYLNYYNFFHIMPKLAVSIFSIIGVFLVNIKHKDLLYFNLYYILNIFVFSVFFILPRYELAVLPLQIMLSCFVLEKIFFKLKKFN